MEQALGQIINGTIDPNWVMVCLMAVVSGLLLRILNRIEKKIDDHGMRIENHEVRITVMEKRE